MLIESVQWSVDAWNDYLYWQSQDKKTLRRINQLVTDIQRHPYDGIGKPEPLKYNHSGFWSRRIDEVNRIVYIVSDGVLSIISCRGHYDSV